MATGLTVNALSASRRRTTVRVAAMLDPLSCVHFDTAGFGAQIGSRARWLEPIEGKRSINHGLSC